MNKEQDMNKEQEFAQAIQNLVAEMEEDNCVFKHDNTHILADPTVYGATGLADAICNFTDWSLRTFTEESWNGGSLAYYTFINEATGQKYWMTEVTQ